MSNFDFFRNKVGFTFDLVCYLFLFSGRWKNDASGADTAIYAALAPHLKGLSRAYFLRPQDKPRWPSREARYFTKSFCSVMFVSMM